MTKDETKKEGITDLSKAVKEYAINPDISLTTSEIAMAGKQIIDMYRNTGKGDAANIMKSL